MITENTVAPAKGSRWEDLVDVFFAPNDLFQRRADESWVKPFVLLCAICVVLYYVFLPLNALVWEAAMVANAPPEADLDDMRKGMSVMKYFGGLGVPFMLLFTILPTAIGLKLASAVLEPGASWRAAFMIATYAMYVVIAQQVFGALAVFIKSRSAAITMNDVSFGVLRFIDEPDSVLQAVLGRLDLFAIWTAVLTAVGLVIVVRMPRGKAIATAVVAWLLVALPALATAAIFGRN